MEFFPRYTTKPPMALDLFRIVGENIMSSVILVSLRMFVTLMILLGRETIGLLLEDITHETLTVRADFWLWREV